jgi:16S rRNA (cytosine1402-N4)-methyltransferase
MEPFHLPVLLRETMDALAIRSAGIYVDGTVGGGGHARAILETSGPRGVLIGLDYDEDALSAAKNNLAPYGERVTLIKGNYSDMKAILQSMNISGVNGILLDLGLSSRQLADPKRGFSFAQDGPLDMRQNRESNLTAYDLVNLAGPDQLETIIRTWGEEKMARAITGAIVTRRKQGPITGTAELAFLVTQAIRGRARGKVHPATKTFQALRIAVNAELENLSSFLDGALDLLLPGGRLAVISFHSLEDRLVKAAFANWTAKCVCPRFLPRCTCEGRPKARLVWKKAVTPAESEIKLNPRARSARLRAIERI